jgi:hypothetical protein
LALAAPDNPISLPYICALPAPARILANRPKTLR